jgi:ribonuclease P protein component
MKFSQSLKKRTDFTTMYRMGRSYANKYLVMYVKDNGSNNNRLGISVSKRVGNSVVRHHVTRLIRESYRLHEEEFHMGKDIVVVARTVCAHEKYFLIESALLHLAKIHHIVA